MGTTRIGRYLNTKGSSRSVSEYALVHSNEGGFVRRQIRVKGKPDVELRLAGGGHGQDGKALLDKYHIKYNVLKIHSNGVLVGNVPDHRRSSKRKGLVQTWFPESWSTKDIRRAGEHVAGLRKNRHLPDQVRIFGMDYSQ